AELEALVDEWEVGQEVSGGGVRDDGPVRVRPGAQAEALERSAPALDDTHRRAAGALDARESDRLRRCTGHGGGRLHGPVEQRIEYVERLPEPERTLLEARLHAARGACGHLRVEAVVREPAARAAHVLGDPARARCRADGAERASVLRRDDPDVGEPVLERRVEEQLTPAA